jgi:hypothetical protein
MFFFAGTALTTRQIVATKASAALGRVVLITEVKLLGATGAAYSFAVVS